MDGHYHDKGTDRLLNDIDQIDPKEFETAEETGAGLAGVLASAATILMAVLIAGFLMFALWIAC